MRRSSKLPKDINQLAAEIVRRSTEEPPKEEKPEKEEKSVPSPIRQYLAKIGRAGGLKGGKARAKKLTAKERISIARKAAKLRWAAKAGE